jgi:hypothetical protein
MLLNGKAPLPGQIVQLPNLAKTFREVVAKGKDGFYKGRVAQAIVDLIQSKGGVMELKDLANHKSTVVEPIKYTYANEVTVYEVRRFYSTLPLYLTPLVPSKWTRQVCQSLTNFFFFEPGVHQVLLLSLPWVSWRISKSKVYHVLCWRWNIIPRNIFIR